MILPIYGYGFPVLKQKAKVIDKDYPEFETLLANMWETMYNSEGVGLAAPQVGMSIRLFLVDSIQMMKEGEEDQGVKQAFINAEIIEEGGGEWEYEEGCLSIPDVRGNVTRERQIKIKYQDENFEEHTQVFTGVNARVIQHEYDHIEGKLFVDMLKPIRKRRVKRRLEKIKKGDIEVGYKMKFFIR